MLCLPVPDHNGKMPIAHSLCEHALPTQHIRRAVSLFYLLRATGRVFVAGLTGRIARRRIEHKTAVFQS